MGNPWLDHVKKTRTSSSGTMFKDVLKKQNNLKKTLGAVKPTVKALQKG